MKTLCQKGIHITASYGVEEKDKSQYRLYRTCTCQTKKKFLYGGAYVTDETLTKTGTF